MLPARLKSPGGVPQTAPPSDSDQSARWKLPQPPAAKALLQVPWRRFPELGSGPLFFSFVPRLELLACPHAKFLLAVFYAYLIKQIRQSSHARGRDMRELPLVELANRRIEALQQSQSTARDSRFDHAPVVTLALPRNQVALFHAVQQSCHVRVVRNHAFRDAAAGQPLRLCAAQNAEHIVLCAGWAFVF